MIKECYPALLISLVVQRNSSGIDAAATLYCVFPLESSDINKHHSSITAKNIRSSIELLIFSVSIVIPAVPKPQYLI